MEKQIPETDQWLLDGNCDKCRREKYCDKDCSAFKKVVAKALNDAYLKALQHSQEKWNEEHPYVDQNCNRHATEEEMQQANERIERLKHAKKNIDESCDACRIPVNTSTDNNIAEGE